MDTVWSLTRHLEIDAISSLVIEGRLCTGRFDRHDDDAEIFRASQASTEIRLGRRAGQRLAATMSADANRHKA